MVSSSFTLSFSGSEARLVEVQCASVPGLPGFQVVGLPDKAVSEARERVRSALTALALALPARRITIHLAPADLPKEGAHYDLPIALALLAEIGVLAGESTARTLSLGELALDGRLIAINGALPAAISAAQHGKQLLVPGANAAEGAWVGAAEVFGPERLEQALHHLSGRQPLPRARPEPALSGGGSHRPDFSEIRGQERAKRGLEIAAAGGHHLVMIGPPGQGKSMLAKAFPGILPELTPAEMLETAILRSLSGESGRTTMSPEPPFRDPHHSASLAALCGGGRRAGPGELSLAHNGVLFLDELPEFAPHTLDALRQPLESGEILIARAEAKLRYQARFQLIAAANPCRCGHATDPARACAKAPGCARSYLQRVSGPLWDRFDLRLDITPVRAAELARLPPGEPSAQIALRVAAARARQAARNGAEAGRLNARVPARDLEDRMPPAPEAADLLVRAADHFGLSARGYHRVLRVARTIADLAEAERVQSDHIAEALNYRGNDLRPS